MRVKHKTQQPSVKLKLLIQTTCGQLWRQLQVISTSVGYPHPSFCSTGVFLQSLDHIVWRKRIITAPTHEQRHNWFCWFANYGSSLEPFRMHPRDLNGQNMRFQLTKILSCSCLTYFIAEHMRDHISRKVCEMSELRCGNCQSHTYLQVRRIGDCYNHQPKQQKQGRLNPQPSTSN